MAWPQVVPAQIQRRRLVAEYLGGHGNCLGFVYLFGGGVENSELLRKTSKLFCTAHLNVVAPCTAPQLCRLSNIERERGRQRPRERERECVCVCVSI